MGLLYFYIGFSYLFQIGSAINKPLPTWNILFAPLLLPMALGKAFSIIIEKCNR